MWKFSEHRESNTLVTLYWYLYKYGGIFACPISNTGVGYCLFVFRSFHNLRSDKLIGSTLSFFNLTNHFQESGGIFTTMNIEHFVASYDAPSMEVIEMALEQGFSASNSTGEDWEYGEIEG